VLTAGDRTVAALRKPVISGVGFREPAGSDRPQHARPGGGCLPESRSRGQGGLVQSHLGQLVSIAKGLYGRLLTSGGRWEPSGGGPVVGRLKHHRSRFVSAVVDRAGSIRRAAVFRASRPIARFG